MQRIAIESMVWTAIDTVYIKQCTCEGAQGLGEVFLPCRTAIDARKWHEIDADMTLEHVMGSFW